MKKILGTMLAVFLLTVSGAFASEGNSVENDIRIEALLSEAESFSVDNPSHDPFKPLLTKKIRIPEPAQEVITIREEEPRKKIVPPVTVKVAGICGNSKNRYAVIEFEGSQYVVKSGETVNGKFSVISILEDGIVIFSFEQSLRNVFKLS